VLARVEEAWQNSPARRADNWPQSEQVTWTFPGGELIAGQELTVDWFDGEFQVPKDVRALYPKDKYPEEAVLLVGTEGLLLQMVGRSPVLFPQEKFKAYAQPKLTRRNHYHHFVEACLGRARTEAHFAQTGPMMETILLGTVAIRCPGQKLAWDAGAMKIPNHPDAERFLKRQYRTGWQAG